MAKTGIATIAFFVIVASSVKGFLYSQMKDVLSDTAIPTCLGQNVTFPADFLSSAVGSPAVNIFSVEWFKNDGNKEHLLAVNTSGHFLPVPGIKHALQYVPGKGVVMPVLQEAALGHYTARVRSIQENAVHVQTYQVMLVQQDDIHLDHEKLQAYITDDVIYDQSTREWHVQLQCGHFLSEDEDSVDVSWITPSNQLLNSTKSEDGNFLLHVPNPVEHGLYSCVLHTTHCLNKRTASGKVGDVFVNGMEQRLRVAEASLSALQRHCSTEQCGNLTAQPAQPPSASDQEGVVREGDYILAFRLTPRIGQSAYDTYVKVGHNDDDPLVRSAMPPGCLTVDGSQPCDRHYRSKVLDLWDRLNLKRARVSLYVNKSEVVYFEFNAEGSDYINWFSKQRAVNTSYSDFFKEPTNHCSISGAGKHRRFFINRSYGGCPKDAGWIDVTDSNEGCRPHWGPSAPYPVVGYVHGSTYQLWPKKSAVRYADVMAIWVKRK